MNLVLGSRFRRVAVPVGLMSAGAAVCCPAQTVAVVKVTGLFPECRSPGRASQQPDCVQSVTVLLSFFPQVTGKKLYAAGQWSSAAVSSLVTPKPQEAVSKEPEQVSWPIHSLDTFLGPITNVLNQ